MRKLNAMGVVLTAALTAGAVTPLTVNFAKESGPIKKLNGVCNAAPLTNTQTGGIKELVNALKTPFYRFHDAALADPGYALVDISRIFPLFHLDPDDERNYNFEVTDDYLRPCVEQGAQIDFRLGESIEHALKNYRVNPPADFEKWAEICAHVVRHYNCGWAKGHRWNIRYWSVWEEPDNPELLTGDSYEKVYLPLYAATAKRLKREFPDIKVGGPNCMGAWGSLEKFVGYCEKNALPCDFFWWTQYARRPEEYFDAAVRVRKLLDEHGFKDAEIGISEWHLRPVSWAGHGSVGSARHALEWDRELTGTPSAVFVDATLVKMQDAPIDEMFYYLLYGGVWAAIDANKQPRAHYYALKAFAELAEDGTRVEAPTCPAPGWYLLGSKGRDGRGHVLLAALHAEGEPLITLQGGVKPVSVKVIDPVRNLEEVAGWTWNGSLLRIPRLYGDSCVWLVETAPDGDLASDVAWLRKTSAANVKTGRFKMDCGVYAYPPQAKRGYRAFFLRDYAYILEGCVDVIPEDELLDAARLFVKGVTDAGDGVDCIYTDGRFNYKPGGGRVGDNAVIDGAPFTVDVVYLSWAHSRDGAYLKPEFLDRLVLAMEKGLPRNPETGLSHIKPKTPPVCVKMSFDRSPYGFTDVVRKEGDVLFTSLLDVESSRRLAELLEAANRLDEAAKWRDHAANVSDAVNRVFWDDETGLYRSATVTCREHDVWGSAFAVYLGVARGERAMRISQVLKANYDGIVQNGQVRHLLPGVYWAYVDCWKDSYQNGGFWGTASGWVMYALALTDETLAKRMAHDLVKYYRENCIPEWCFNGKGSGFQALEGYLSSSTLPLAAMRRLGWGQ